MENWGLITYRLTSLLYDKHKSSDSNKQWVAVVVAHELAHQVCACFYGKKIRFLEKHWYSCCQILLHVLSFGAGFFSFFVRLTACVCDSVLNTCSCCVLS